MLDIIKRLRAKKGGHILAWLLCVMLVLSVISAAIVSSAYSAVRSTERGNNMQQAHYTAKSAAMTVADYIIKHSTQEDKIQNLIANTGTGTSSKMGDYTVEVTSVSADRLKVTVTAVYRGETVTESVSLVKLPAPSGIIPTENVVYVNGPAGSGINECKLYGSVYVDGDLNMSGSNLIDGFVVVNGNATISGGASTMNGLFSFGSVNMLAGGVTNGDVMALGNLKLHGYGQIMGNAVADGSLDMTQGSGKVHGNVVIGGSASFDGGGDRIGGSLTYAGSFNRPSWASVQYFIGGGATKANYTPIDPSPYVSQPLPILVPPARAAMPELYNPVVISNNTISASGQITSDVLLQIKSLPDASTITIDATQSDISLLLDGIHFNPGGNKKFQVISNGSHNVYFYLTGSSAITLGSNMYLRMRDSNTEPRIYIIGDGSQSVTLNNGEINGYIYIPNGSFTISGNPPSGRFLWGSCIVKTVSLGSGGKLYYCPPDLDGTPLDVFLDGEGNPTGDGRTWSIGSWGAN